MRPVVLLIMTSRLWLVSVSGALTVSVCSPALAAEAPKANNPETEAKAAYDAARKAVSEAATAVAPLRDAVKKADAASAKAQEAVNAKRKKADSAK